ncbi:MAG: GNAT family N-acetyltransferase [archaeon]
MDYGKILKEYSKNGDNIKIRYPIYNDAQDLMETINFLAGEDNYMKYGEDSKVNFEEEIEWLSQKIKNNELKRGLYIVAEVNNKVRGGVNIRKRSKFRSHIGKFGIALHKDIRGKGIGTTISEISFKILEKEYDVEIIVLDVHQDNDKAIKFYKNLGFEKVGVIKKALLVDEEEGEYKDYIKMEKKL